MFTRGYIPRNSKMFPGPAAEKPAARATTFLKPPQSSTPKTSCQFCFKLGPVGTCSKKILKSWLEILPKSIFVGHMLAGLCGAHGKILWVQQIPKHQALLFVGTPKRGLSHFRPWLHNKLVTRWWHAGDMCCRNGAIHTCPTLIYQNLSMNKGWHDLHWSMRIHEENPSLQSAYQNPVGGQWPLQSARAPHRWPHLHLVGGWPTPLKSDGLRQLGWFSIPNWMEK